MLDYSITRKIVEKTPIEKLEDKQIILSYVPYSEEEMEILELIEESYGEDLGAQEISFLLKCGIGLPYEYEKSCPIKKVKNSNLKKVFSHYSVVIIARESTCKLDINWIRKNCKKKIKEDQKILEKNRKKKF